MKISYSKPSNDIQKEGNDIFSADMEMSKRQAIESKLLLKIADRLNCVLCSRPLRGDNFMHRDIPFVMCETCEHVQTKALPPADYPQVNFSNIYQKTDIKEYNNRKNRIYKPKLDWIMNCLREMDYSDQKISQLKWIEMGAGAGYFISCLKDYGIENATGFDSDKDLVKFANDFIPGNREQYYNGKLSDSFDKFPADIYVAFFVIEHISDAYQFFQMLKKRRRGTLFIFSVPMFGFSCLLENIFKDNYARNLDAVFHTQLYTDKSIACAMAEAGYEILAEWVFGQDAMDFTRFMLLNLSDNFSSSMLKQVKNDCIRLQDSMQQCLDLLKLSDQRHLITIRR